MLMNWPREFEHRLVEDERFEPGKARAAGGPAFFYENKELAQLGENSVRIRLTAPGIYALRTRLVEDCVLSVEKE